MPVRNVDLLQDRWHEAGRYSREQSPEMARLMNEMFPEQQRDEVTVKGYSVTYINRIVDRVIEHIGDDALTAREVSEDMGVSIHSVVKALGAAVGAGRLTRNKAAAGRSVRYWIPQDDDLEAE